MHLLRAISRGHKKTARKTISDRFCMYNDNNEFIRYKVFFSDRGSRIFVGGASYQSTISVVTS